MLLCSSEVLLEEGIPIRRLTPMKLPSWSEEGISHLRNSRNCRMGGGLKGRQTGKTEIMVDFELLFSQLFEIQH